MAMMRLKFDLRQHLGVIVSEANGLFKTLEALPGTEEAMLEAVEALSMEERRQAAHYFTALSQRFYEMHERSRWLRRLFTERTE
jgi:hypothetical protein